MPVDVEFELLWRHAGGGDVPIATWNQHFDPLGNGNFDGQPCELTAESDVAVDFNEGDELVFRYTGTGTDTPMAYIPVGSPIVEAGRFTQIFVPQ